MINISKSGNAIKFAFTDSDHYLYGSGEIECPVNSLSLIVDESNMITFRKSNSNDIFLSFDPANSNLSDKAGVINFYKTEMVGSTGGGTESGITSGDVQTMIDNSLEDYYDKDEVDAGFDEVDAALSGKADASDVTALENEVAAKADTATTYTKTEVDAALSGKADTSAVTAVENDVLTLQDALAGKANTAALTAHTADTSVHVSQQEKNAWNAKAEPYSAGTGIDITNNVISATGDYYEQVSGLTIEYNSDSQTPEVLLQVEDEELGAVSNLFNKYGVDTYQEMEDGSNYGSYIGQGSIGNSATDSPDENVTSERSLEITTDGFRQTTFENYDDGESGYTRYSSENEFNYSNGLTLSQQWYDPENDETTTSSIEINNNDGTSIHFTDGSDELDLNNQMFDWTDGTDSRSIRWGDIASLNDIPEYSAGTGIEISGNVISATGGGSVTVDPTLDTGSTNPVANSAITNGFNEYTLRRNSENGEVRYFYVSSPSQPYGGGGQMFSNFSINGRCPLTQTNGTNSYIDKFNLVETSAITSAITSASTNAEVAGAKAVYDAIQAGGGGGGSVTVDPTLDTGSTNPVANSAITAAVNDLDYRKADVSEMYYLLDGSIEEGISPIRFMRISQSDYDTLVENYETEPDVLYIITPDEENEGGNDWEE